MRAIKINPLDKTITEVEYDGNYKSIYKLIEAQMFDVVRIGDKEDHTIYVDDEGLMNGKARDVGFFRIEGDYPIALAGYGLILATNDEGESVECKLSLDDVKKMTTFGIPMRINGCICFAEYKTDRILRLA